MVALLVFVVSILVVHNVLSRHLFSTTRDLLEKQLQSHLLTYVRTLAGDLYQYDLLELRNTERNGAVYLLVHDKLADYCSAESDLAGAFILDPIDDCVLVSTTEEAERGQRYLFADLDRPQIRVAQSGFCSATPSQSRASMLFMNSYGPLGDMLGTELVLGVKANVHYQKTIDSVRNGILFANVFGAVVIGGLAFLYYRQERRLVRQEEAIFQQEKLATLGQLAAGIAHEIRNPLGIMKQALHLLRKESPSEKSGKCLEYIEEAIQRVNRLVEDVLSFSKREPIHTVVGDLAATVDLAVGLVDYRLKQAGVELLREYAPHSSVHFDPGRMEQVVVNLLLNAVEVLSPGGKIHLRIVDDDQWIRLQVEDNGPGIRPDELPGIMEPFRTSKEQGTGLGLAIVDRIVQAHGGEVQVESQVGKGTCFTVRLPKEAAM